MTRRLPSEFPLAAATTLGLTSLLIASLFFARTQTVAGPVVRDRLHSVAKRLDADLHVGAMRPTGLLGVRLEEVTVDISRGPVDLKVQTPALDVRPSLGGLLSGQLAPGHVRMHGGEVVVSRSRTRRQTDQTSKPAEPTDAEDSTTSSSAPTNDHATEPPRRPPPLEVELQQVEFRGATGRLQTRAVHVEQVELGVARGPSDQPLVRATGFGRLPGDRAFSLSSRREPRGDEKQLVLSVDTSTPTSLSDLLGLRLPVDARSSHLSVCPTCESRVVCVESPTVEAGRLAFPTSQACLHRTGPGISIRVDEANILHAGETLPWRWTELKLDLWAPDSPMVFEATLEGRERDRLSCHSRINSTDGNVEFDLETDGFRLGELWPVLGVGAYLEGGRIDGSATIDLYPHTRLATIRTDFDYRDLTLTHDFLDDRPIELQESRLQLDAVTDFRLEDISLVDTRLTLGDLKPLHATGYLSRARPGWAFELNAGARDVDAARLRDTLPETVATPALGAELTGSFDTSLYTTAHTAFPESLMLEVGFDGDVEVRRESPNTDVPTLAADGPPTPFLPALKQAQMPLSKWVDLDSIDSVIPRVVLSAEDARFHHHPGFDWRGIRNAMVHNLQVGRLERGGSTITQQLAKNLFLTHDRTLTRKFKELWIAWRLEEELGKERILELYLNLVEWGPDVRGLHEAARYYFDRSPGEMTIPQVVVLGAILPGPHLYGPLLKHGYLPSSRLEKIEHILNNLRYFDIIDQKGYERIYTGAKWGMIAGYDLTVCRDNDFAPQGAPDCPSPGEARAAKDNQRTGG
jgi:monofunctional biosynthetic peptidoglycan transglycosylase